MTGQVTDEIPGERNAKYNAHVIREIERELIGPVELERLQRAPMWIKSLVNELVKRIANLRATVYELQKGR